MMTDIQSSKYTDLHRCCKSCVGKMHLMNSQIRPGHWHSETGPASRQTICIPEDYRHEYHIAWYHRGKIHRDGGPARIVTKLWGSTISERLVEWYKDDVLHREDGPARIISYTATGGQTFEEWFINGVEIDIKKLAEYIKLPKEDKVSIKLVYG